MAHTAVIHARIDSDTKEATERVLNTLGLTPADAIRLLYRQIALMGEFPLELRVLDQVTGNTLAKADRGEELERFDSTEALYASWES